MTAKDGAMAGDLRMVFAEDWDSTGASRRSWKLSGV